MRTGDSAIGESRATANQAPEISPAERVRQVRTTCGDNVERTVAMTPRTATTTSPMHISVLAEEKPERTRAPAR
jgi:hypothetical protein